jgi:hypothetical protein
MVLKFKIKVLHLTRAFMLNHPLIEDRRAREEKSEYESKRETRDRRERDIKLTASSPFSMSINPFMKTELL